MIEKMSAEESDKRKRIPKGLEMALANLARKTVENNWDVGKVVWTLDRLLRWWASLTPEQREAVRRELERTRVPRVAQRKPRRRREI